jgi:hypothetical protein
LGILPLVFVEMVVARVEMEMVEKHVQLDMN